MSAILEFYRNDGRDSEGRTLDEILKMGDGFWERSHDHIQWVFPLDTPSNFNPDAPVLTQEDMAEFRACLSRGGNDHVVHYNLHMSYVRFLKFLGLHSNKDDGEVTELHGEPAAARRRATLSRFNHNFLRITRCLRSMKLVGHGWVSDDLLAYLKKEGYDQSWPTSWAHWEDACRPIDQSPQ